jgi:hypothetical protein
MHAAHEIGENAQENTADERATERERQEQAAGDGAVKPLNEQAAKGRVRPDSLAEDARGLERGTSRGDRRAAVPLRGEESRDHTGERSEQIDEKRYGANPFRGGTRLTGVGSWFPSLEDEKPRENSSPHRRTHADVD